MSSINHQAELLRNGLLEWKHELLRERNALLAERRQLEEQIVKLLARFAVVGAIRHQLVDDSYGLVLSEQIRQLQEQHRRLLGGGRLEDIHRLVREIDRQLIEGASRLPATGAADWSDR